MRMCVRAGNCFTVLVLGVVLLALAGCHDGPPQPSRFRSTMIGKWRDDRPQNPVTERMLVFNNNGVMTDTWVLFDIDSMKCTAWATYRVMEYGNGTYVDMNFTHIVGACDTMTFKSGSMKLDVRDTNHILYGDASFTRVQ